MPQETENRSGDNAEVESEEPQVDVGATEETEPSYSYSDHERRELGEKFSRPDELVKKASDERKVISRSRGSRLEQRRKRLLDLIDQKKDKALVIDEEMLYCASHERINLRGRKKQIAEEIEKLEIELEETEQQIRGELKEEFSFEKWFCDELSSREKYFVIMLSLFEGVKWTDFWEIYQALLEAKNLLINEDDKQGNFWFEQTDEELINRAEAHIIWDDDLSGEVIEFTNVNDAAVILALMRRSYRPRLIELLPSLGKLGEHSDLEIRARAAYAVAEIAKLDFDRVRRRVLEVWARDDRAYVRAVAGYTISRLLEDSAYADVVNKMLDSWSDPQQKRNWKYRWAAAAAYKQVGLDKPEDALTGLRTVARNDDIRVADAIIYALLVISFEEHLDQVLNALREWLNEDEKKQDKLNVVPLVGTLAFLTLGNVYTGLAELEPEDGKKEDDQVLMLFAADVDKSWRAVALSALSCSLKYHLTDAVFNVFKGWAKQTEDNHMHLATLRDLIADWYMELWYRQHQIGMTSTWNRLKRWSRDKDATVQHAGQVILAEIKQRTDAAPLPANKKIVFGT